MYGNSAWNVLHFIEYSYKNRQLTYMNKEHRSRIKKNPSQKHTNIGNVATPISQIKRKVFENHFYFQDSPTNGT